MSRKHKHSDPEVRKLLLRALVEQGSGPVFASSAQELRLLLDYPGLIGRSQGVFNAALGSLAHNPNNKFIALWHPRNADGTKGIAVRLRKPAGSLDSTTHADAAATVGVA